MKQNKLEKLCEHIDYCLYRKSLRDKNKYINCSKNVKLKCTEYKNYNKYGEDYNNLGV